MHSRSCLFYPDNSNDKIRDVKKKQKKQGNHNFDNNMVDYGNNKDKHGDNTGNNRDHKTKDGGSSRVLASCSGSEVKVEDNENKAPPLALYLLTPLVLLSLPIPEVIVKITSIAVS